MARVSISEAARLTGKSRTTLHRLIKTGDLSTCSGERNAKMVDTSELLRVFGPFEQPKGEHHSGQVSEQRDTASADQSEQVIRHLKQEIEHLNILLLSKDSHIDSLKQAMLLLEKLNELDLDAEADLCEKLHDDAEHLFRTLSSRLDALQDGN
ncbi:Excl1 protein [Klebsiella pneumoniae]|nr:Excl1 protein [Klebsiella pneumoniae]